MHPALGAVSTRDAWVISQAAYAVQTAAAPRTDVASATTADTPSSAALPADASALTAGAGPSSSTSSSGSGAPALIGHLADSGIPSPGIHGSILTVDDDAPPAAPAARADVHPD